MDLLKFYVLLMQSGSEEKENHKSLWNDDEEKPNEPSPEEVANDGSVQGAAPEIVSVDEVIAEAVGNL